MSYGEWRALGSVKKTLLWALGPLLAAVALLVLLWPEEDTRSVASTQPLASPAVEVVVAAAARIATESRSPTTAPPVVRAAPVSRREHRTVEAGDSDAHVLPEGYTVVGANGEMAKAFVGVHDSPLHMGDGLEWLGAPTAIEALAAQAKDNGRGWSFGWIRLAARSREADLASSLEGAGARIVGSAGRLLRVRLPGDEERLAAIASMPGVDGLGAMPTEAKLRAFDGQSVADHEPTPVFVTLMSDDPRGRWRRELANLGAVVGRYDPQIRVYTANVTRSVLDALGAADFVLAVEPVGMVEAVHDTSIPAMGADALRTWTGTGLFEGIGGASVPIGVMDTGLNIRHADIRENRTSICGTNFVWLEAREQDEDLWSDAGAHGTHVTGTIIGNGFGSGAFAGMAPSVQHVRFAKVLHSTGAGASDGVLRGMDWLATESGCEDSDEVRPQIVNMSLSGRGFRFEGRDVSARKLDAVVWDSRQLYVVAQANAGSLGFSNFGAAKNSLAVGASHDSGNHAAFSSHGPTADRRLAPHVVAPGVEVCSARGDAAATGYVCFNGTSMASPTVAGTAALLMDASPEYAGHPALARARLMAGAIRPDAWLEDRKAFAPDNSGGPSRLQVLYGLGKASARTTVLARDADDGWTGGGATADFTDADTYTFEDIQIPEGATRLDVVLTWDEPPVDAVSQSVLNDLDLWLDAGADCENGACGEHSSASRIDNVEWVIVKDPAPGTWRLKIVGRRVHTEARAAVAWTVIRGASTPTLAVETGTTTDNAVEDVAWVGFDLSVTVDSYVAAGTALHFECRGEPGDCDDSSLRIEARDLEREDGLETAAGEGESAERGTTVPLGHKIALGEIAAGETQAVDLQVEYSGSKPVRLYYTASAWNASPASGSVVIRPAESPDGDEAPVAHQPANDDFALATSIQDEEGSAAVDLAGATPEPGEPPASTLTADFPEQDQSRWEERPLGSVWYRWTAPTSGLATFWLVSERHPPGSETLAVFTGTTPTALDPVASNQWGERDTVLLLGFFPIHTETIHTGGTAAFFAERGETYSVRVANSDRSTGGLTLRWYQGERPANDDFATGYELAGTEGEHEGSNAGATLEGGESFGELAATTWHRWTAPADGAWTFDVGGEHLRVAAFTGDEVRGLRLVSGFPDTEATFQAGAGEVYRIAVAAKDAFSTGGPYTLAWQTTAWAPSESDDFATGRSFTAESGSQNWEIGRSATVSPGEPPETGVRTIWWSWTAPSSGNYTWRLDTYSTELTMAAFAGAAVDDLQMTGSTASRVTGREFSFEADSGTTYAFSLGWPAGDIGAYTAVGAEGSVSWGRSPANDESQNAIALRSPRGSTGANDQYGTTGPGEFDDLLGHSSLWWTWDAPADGWYTFAAGDRHVAVYAAGTDAPVAQQWLLDGEVTFRAEAGTTYTIRTGSPVESDGGTYRLSWRPTEAPAWLGYAGAVADGVDEQGTAIRLSNPGSLAASDDGTAVFALSDYGLEVFRPDANGALTASQTIDEDLSDSILARDPDRARLLANRCGDWFAFERDGDVFAATDLEVSDDPASCGVKLLTTPDGSSVYRAGDAGLDRFEVGDDGNLRFIDTPTGSSGGVSDAVLTADGSRLYTVGESRLRGFERDTSTGALTTTSERFFWGEWSLGMTGDDRWLFAAGESSWAGVEVFELPSLASRGEVGYDNPLFRTWNHTPYRFVVGRPTAAADVFGNSVALSIDAQAGMTDALAGADRFGNPVPTFGVPNDIAPSADGRHVYASTDDHGIVFFERIGAGVEPVDPHVRLDGLEVSSGLISFGPESDSDGCVAVDSLAHDGVTYTVKSSKWQQRRNADWPWADVAGTAATGELCPFTPSDPGHYRLVAEVELDGETGHYASNTLVHDDHGDSAEDATPVDVPSATTGFLDPDDADYFRVETTMYGTLTVYSEGWTDTQGSLLDESGEEIASDSDGGTDLNFRISLDLDAGVYVVRVAGLGQSPIEYTLHVEFQEPAPDLVIASTEVSATPAVGETFTLSVEVRNDGNGSAPATTLRYYRSDDGHISADDDEIGTEEIGTLAPDETSEHSIEVTVTQAESHYGACVDTVDDETDATNNCTPTATEITAGFELDSENADPGGIAHADGLLYVADWWDEKVYVYTTAGERRADSDFDLDSENSFPRRIAHAGGLLYVVDTIDNKVYVYTTSGERRANADFDLAAANEQSGGIAHTDGLFYVLDWNVFPGKVFVYTTSGEHQADSDFDLARYRSGGIAHADGLLYLAQWLGGDTIHAYSLSGERRSDKDFDLDPENTSVFGMDHDGTSFYLVDDEALRVFVYDGDDVAGGTKAGNGSEQAITEESRKNGNAAHRAERRKDEEARRRNLETPSGR